MKEVLSSSGVVLCAHSSGGHRFHTSVQTLPKGKVAAVVMIFQLLLTKSNEWMKQAISLDEEERAKLFDTDLYCFVAVIFLSHSSDCSLQKGMETLQEMEEENLTLESCHYIVMHILAFAATTHRKYFRAEGTWQAQLDQTSELDKSETAASDLAIRVFFATPPPGGNYQ